MLISIRAAATYDLDAETFVMLMVEPAVEGPDHHVREARLATSPTRYSVLGTDFSGNVQRRLVAPAGEFRYEYEANIEAEPNIDVPPDAIAHDLQELPAETLIYLMPS